MLQYYTSYFSPIGHQIDGISGEFGTLLFLGISVKIDPSDYLFWLFYFEDEKNETKIEISEPGLRLVLTG